MTKPIGYARNKFACMILVLTIALVSAFALRAQTGTTPTNIKAASPGSPAQFIVSSPDGKAVFARFGAGFSLTPIANSNFYLLTFSGASEVVNEKPAVTFVSGQSQVTLQFAPVPASIRLFLNGIRQAPDLDYTVEGSVVKFVSARGDLTALAETVLVDYRTQ